MKKLENVIMKLTDPRQIRCACLLQALAATMPSHPLVLEMCDLLIAEGTLIFYLINFYCPLRL